MFLFLFHWRLRGRSPDRLEWRFRTHCCRKGWGGGGRAHEGRTREKKKKKKKQVDWERKLWADTWGWGGEMWGEWRWALNTNTLSPGRQYFPAVLLFPTKRLFCSPGIFAHKRTLHFPYILICLPDGVSHTNVYSSRQTNRPMSGSIEGHLNWCIDE